MNAKSLAVLLLFAPLLAQAGDLLNVTSTLNTGDPTQMGRLSRDNVVADWSTTKAFPGTFSSGVSYRYRTYSIPAATLLSTPYVQVSCNNLNGHLFVAAYANSYDPANQSVNYLGDAGTSGNFFTADPVFFQLHLSPGDSLVLVVNDTDSTGAGVGESFHLRAEGFANTLYSSTSATPTPTPTATPTPTPSATPTPTATATATASPTPSATPNPSPTATPAPTPENVQLLNISARASVQTGDNIAIDGFIVSGSASKKIIARALGPSLKIKGSLKNPTLDLYDRNGRVVASNDNWTSSPKKSQIQNSGLAPGDPRESAVLVTLSPGAYTAVVRGVNNTTGIALTEIYDLQSTNGSVLGNLSARAFVGTGDNVLIDGVIVVGANAKTILFRGLGPSLGKAGVNGALTNPKLELYNRNGALIATNDDWKNAPNHSAIQKSGLAPSDDRESAIMISLSHGPYTLILRGAGGETGIALAESYRLP